MGTEIFSLRGKTALVTGASSGLGHHIAGVLAEAGAQVVVAARREAKLAQLVEQIKSRGNQAQAITMDVTSSDSVAAAYDQIERDTGLVDVLVNNAGVADTKFFVDVEEKDWDYIMETNLKGAWRVASECSRRLVKTNTPGSIINMASLLGMVTQSMQSIYAISKAGVIHMTHSMASELARHQVRVNAIAPGYFQTEMNEEFFASEKGQAYIKTLPSRRLGRPEELTGAVLLLASEAGSFINGIVIPVDGGHLVAGR